MAYVASFFGMGQVLRFCFDPSISKETVTFWVSRDVLKRSPEMIASEQDLGNPDFYSDSLTALKVHTTNWLHVCATIYIAPQPQIEDAAPPQPPQETYTSEPGTDAWMEEFKAKTEQWEKFLTHRPLSPTRAYARPLVYQGL